jgi:sucrose-6-phosphate hydrolase SacC (GH32 family)
MQKETHNFSRRVFLQTVGIGAAVAAAGLPLLEADPASAATSLRAHYHLTPPKGWLSDPQRPIFTDDNYQLYYLHSPQNNSPGWWEHAQTGDNVVFTDEGVAIPLGPNFPVWTGSAVVDVNNTAGFGAGTVVALATQPTGGDAYKQEQYLWYSTDGGFTFTAYGNPVIPNPGHSDWFRDPKILWDSAHSQWIAPIGRPQAADFYASPDLKNWTYQSAFSYTSPNIGGFECPDIFQITADDGTSHWVFAASMQGDYSGFPNTYAYWTGSWNGTAFVPDSATPQWLDWGLDWYAAVTWPDAENPNTNRFAIAWMNNWEYANRTVPTDVSDGYNGQMSIVRQLSLSNAGNGQYSILSAPVSTLNGHASNTITLSDVTLNGYKLLSYSGSSYRLDVDIQWQHLNNVGLSVGVNGLRHTNIGIYQGKLYVDRTASDQLLYTFAPWFQANAPVNASATSFHLTVLVDTQSVEVLTGDGVTAVSSQVYFLPADTGLALYTDGGSATFRNITIKEFAPGTAG